MVKWKGKIDKGVLTASSTLTDGVLPITIVIKVFLKVLKNYTIWLCASLYCMTSHLADFSISIERVWQSFCLRSCYCVNCYFDEQSLCKAESRFGTQETMTRPKTVISDIFPPQFLFFFFLFSWSLLVCCSCFPSLWCQVPA